MRPSHLKSPFSWDHRHVLIDDHVWYIPALCADNQNFSFPGWDHPLVFAEERPICIEYCSGNGLWIADKARAHPELNWVAVEIKFTRVRKIWSKIKNLNISNLLAICGEGHRATQEYFPSESVQSVYINFPDPWPKTRHAKHRIVQIPFIKEIQRILKPNGTLTMVTDDEGYSEWMLDVLKNVPGLHSLLPYPFYTHDYPAYGTSYFDDLWRYKGKLIRYH